MDRLGFVRGQLLWASPNRKRLYTWDGLHGEIEAFNRRGVHMGALDPLTGVFIKGEDKRKKLDV
jgi:hypothetical protein